MKGLGDISQHICIKHLESKRCMGEPSWHKMANKGQKSEHTKGSWRRGLDWNEGQKSEQGCSKSA